MPPRSQPHDRDLLERNRRYYDQLWSDATFIEPQRFNTWPLVESLLSTAERRLEVAPGLRPRLPLIGTQFVDISAPAAVKLHARGAQVVLAEASALPFAQDTFDLVCALDVVEHVDDDDAMVSELSRVTRAGGSLLISAPLHPSRWTPFDEIVGHKRRYEPRQLLGMLADHRLQVERSAVFGMQPRSSRLVDIGMWWLLHHRERAMWWYNRVFMRLALRFQKKLRFSAGMTADDVDEVLLVCRRVAADGPARSSH
ncbi:MAG: methyltransferase domain-containing protein [Steroidobacteraceae bacterium]